MSKKIKLSIDDLKKHLEVQLQYIKSSCELFDSGIDEEANRLAVSIRVLVHDTNNSNSLLNQLNIKNIDFYDMSFEYKQKYSASHFGLVWLALGDPFTGYCAMLDGIPNIYVKKIKFTEWWNKIVIVDKDKNKLTRKDLVLKAANEDGGAHVDPNLNEVYANLSRKNSMGWISHTINGDSGIEGVEKSSIRQIAHEILKTLISGYEKELEIETELLLGCPNIWNAEAIELKSNNINKLISNVSVLVENAKKLIKIKNYNEAIRLLNKAISRFAYYAEAYFYRGYANDKVNNKNEAISDYRKSINIDKSQIITYLNIGEIYFKNNDFNEALDNFNEALKLSQDNEELLYKISWIYRKLNDNTKALEYINRCIKINSDNSKYYLFRGVCYDEMQDYKKTIEDYERVLVINPTNSFVFNNRANIYSKLNKFDKSLEDINQAIKLNPQEAVFYLTRARIYSRKGNIMNAIDNYRSALKINPVLENAKKELDYLLEIQ